MMAILRDTSPSVIETLSTRGNTFPRTVAHHHRDHQIIPEPHQKIRSPEDALCIQWNRYGYDISCRIQSCTMSARRRSPRHQTVQREHQRRKVDQFLARRSKVPGHDSRRHIERRSLGYLQKRSYHSLPADIKSRSSVYTSIVRWHQKSS